MHRWQILLCFAALFAVSAQAQPEIDLSGLLNGLDLNALAAAGEKCDSAKLTAASDACSKAAASTKIPCPPACADLFDTFNSDCGDLLKAIGLDQLLGNCGAGTVVKPTDTPSSPTTEPADGPSSMDYAEPPMPNIDYGDDYASPPAEGPAMVMPISALSPSPEAASPMPMPSPSPMPTPSPAAITGFPASCDAWFAKVQSQGLDKQVACGQALASNPTTCPDACKAIYTERPDEACAKDLAAMTANSPPMPDGTTDAAATNPCFKELGGVIGAGSRSSSMAGLVVAGALAAFMMM